MKANETARNFRIVVLGAKDTGKSALSVRYLTGRYIDEYASGIDVAYSHSITLAGKSLSLQILDTSGNKYSQAALAWADGIIVVYSIDNRKSLKKASEILEEIQSINNRNASVAIVGNKSDLWPHRTVLKYEGELLAKQYNAQHYEVSVSQESKPIRGIFNVLSRKMVEQNNKTEKHANKTPIVFRKLLHKYEKTTV